MDAQFGPKPFFESVFESVPAPFFFPFLEKVDFEMPPIIKNPIYRQIRWMVGVF